jgi:phenylacetate-CoA ligase
LHPSFEQVVFSDLTAAEEWIRMQYWDKKNECMDREDIEQLQIERLYATLHRVYKNVSHYRQTFRAIDFIPEDLRTLEDFKRVPFTCRQDLMNNYPYGMFAVPLREVVRLLAPALTLDRPLVIGFTANDLNNWSELVARNFAAVGANKDDVVQISLTFGMIAGPFGVQLGAERIGASVIPVSGGNLAGQVKIVRDFKTTLLVSTPSFALGLIGAMSDRGVDPNSLSLKYGIFGAEAWSESTREKIETGLHISATDAYGLSEVFGTGVGWECPEKRGLHIPEDHFFPEIIDPVTGDRLPEGAEGELVLTTLTKEAVPLIRYRTGDITRLDKSVCGCGRTHCRINRIFKRVDDLIVMRGTSIIPDQIGEVLAAVIGPNPVYQMVVNRIDDQDQLQVRIAISDRIFFDEMKKQRRLVENLHRVLSEFIGWEVEVRLVEPEAVDPSTRVVDNRTYR